VSWLFSEGRLPSPGDSEDVKEGARAIHSILCRYLFTSALKYAVGVVPNVFLNIEMNALGVL
jgi:hypothetical protein